MSTSNQGRALQGEIDRIANAYRTVGIAKLHKVDPPCRVVGFGAARKVIFMPNPFVDYVGTWTQRGGRSLALEAKSTAEPKLPIRQQSGVTEKQFEALSEWEQHGAAVGILWGYKNEIRFVPMAAARAQLAAGVKHVKWDTATVIPRGLGLVTFDFIKVIAAYFPN